MLFGVDEKPGLSGASIACRCSPPWFGRLHRRAGIELRQNLPRACAPPRSPEIRSHKGSAERSAGRHSWSGCSARWYSPACQGTAERRFASAPQETACTLGALNLKHSLRSSAVASAAAAAAASTHRQVDRENDAMVVVVSKLVDGVRSPVLQAPSL